jgi:hypothetical protein
MLLEWLQMAFIYYIFRVIFCSQKFLYKIFSRLFRGLFNKLQYYEKLYDTSYARIAVLVTSLDDLQQSNPFKTVSNADFN